MKRTLLTAAMSALVLAIPGAAEAQQATDTDTRAQIRALAAEAPTASPHATVQAFLDRDDVRAVAAERGIDVDGLKDRVATLDDAAAANLASRAEDVQDQLAGGDTVTITSTTIIIVLLVIILVIVA
ncbi:MAG: PA2779 family protein [Longimicrobiales bacterium]